MDHLPKILLQSLHNDLRYYADYLQGLSHELLDAGLSRYPIFVAYQDQQIGIGKQVLAHTTLETQWSINVSVLEEFVKKGIIEKEKIQLFRANFKDPETHFCVFWLTENLSGFVFMPFAVSEPTDDETDEPLLTD